MPKIQYLVMIPRQKARVLRKRGNMNRQFSDKEIKTIKKYMRKCSKSLIIREMQIKTTLRYCLTPDRLVNITVGESGER